MLLNVSYLNAKGSNEAASRLNFKCTYSRVLVRNNSVGASELSVLSNEFFLDRGRLKNNQNTQSHYHHILTIPVPHYFIHNS